MKNKPSLFLIPVPLSDDDGSDNLSTRVLRTINELDYFVVENAKTARKHLKKVIADKPIASINIKELVADATDQELESLLTPIKHNYSVGLLSDAGCPAVADPGAKLVNYAHKLNIPVVPLVGPSSILLALMASGLNGQQFSFNGYLPTQEAEKIKKIKSLEQRSRINKETQICIETPYRNQALFQSLLQHLAPTTMLTVAADLNGHEESITTQAVEIWRQNPTELHKVPTIYLFLAQ